MMIKHNEAYELAKKEAAKMETSYLGKAYFIFKAEGNRSGEALMMDELMRRFPDIYAKLYDAETYDLDENEFIDQSMKRVQIRRIK